MMRRPELNQVDPGLLGSMVAPSEEQSVLEAAMAR